MLFENPREPRSCQLCNPIFNLVLKATLSSHCSVNLFLVQFLFSVVFVIITSDKVNKNGNK